MWVKFVLNLGDGSALAVTIAKYYTPSGRDINKHGIKPDVVVELTEEQKKALTADRTQVGTVNDPQYAKALQVLKQEIAKRGNSAASTTSR